MKKLDTDWIVKASGQPNKDDLLNDNYPTGGGHLKIFQHQHIVMIMGLMASGKSSMSKFYIDQGYVWINRDALGGTIKGLEKYVRAALKEKKSVVLDNTFPTKKSRELFVNLAKEYNIPIDCIHLNTSLNDAERNYCHRMLSITGKALSYEEMKKLKHPNVFDPYVLTNYLKNLELPSLEEGFSTVRTMSFVRKIDPEYKNKAIIFDYDGTLRITNNGGMYPTDPSHVGILPGRKEKLQELKEDGYILLGISNQSGIATWKLTMEQAKACFDKTNELLGQKIDYLFCPHPSWPIKCWCRKPHLFNAVQFIEKYKLDVSQTFFVGDYKTDQEMAEKIGFKYYDQKDFFKEI